MAENNSKDKEQSTGQETTLKSFNTVLDTLQKSITLVVALAAFWTASGFVIVTIHLSNYTDITSYNIHSTQYLSAGISFFIASIVSLIILIVILYGLQRFKLDSDISELLAIITSVLVVNPILLIDPIAIAFQIISENRKTRRQASASKPYDSPANTQQTPKSNESTDASDNRSSTPLSEQTKTALASPSPNISNVIPIFSPLGIFFIVVYIVVFGGIYSKLFYGNIVPRWLGGAQPDSIQLILSDSALAQILNIEIDTTITSQENNYVLTKPVMRLADLVDGLLVGNLDTGKAIAIKNDNIVGIVDDVENDSIRSLSPAKTTETSETTETPNANSSTTSPEETDSANP